MKEESGPLYLGEADGCSRWSPQEGCPGRDSPPLLSGPSPSTREDAGKL